MGWPAAGDRFIRGVPLKRFVAKTRRGLQPVKFSTQLQLLTLANETVLLIAAGQALEQDFDIISTDLVLSLRDMTDTEGPLDAGLAGEDYTVGEIGECLNANPLRSQGTEYEKSNRKVRTFVLFSGSGTDRVPEGTPGPIRRKMFLRAPAGQVPANVWIRNRSGGSLTTGGFLEVSGTYWGRWK